MPLCEFEVGGAHLFLHESFPVLVIPDFDHGLFDRTRRGLLALCCIVGGHGQWLLEAFLLVVKKLGGVLVFEPFNEVTKGNRVVGEDWVRRTTVSRFWRISSSRGATSVA
jgi:hypothetical protein